MSEQNKEFDPKEILENPTLESLAILIVDMIEMTQGQMQSNIVFSSLVNTVTTIMVEKGITTEEEFSSKLEESLTAMTKQYNDTIDNFQTEDSEEDEELPKSPKESNDE